MLSWEIGVLVGLGVLWWFVIRFCQWSRSLDERAMRDYRRARERFEDQFLDE